MVPIPTKTLLPIARGPKLSIWLRSEGPCPYIKKTALLVDNYSDGAGVVYALVPRYVFPLPAGYG